MQLRQAEADVRNKREPELVRYESNGPVQSRRMHGTGEGADARVPKLDLSRMLERQAANAQAAKSGNAGGGGAGLPAQPFLLPAVRTPSSGSPTTPDQATGEIPPCFIFFPACCIRTGL